MDLKQTNIDDVYANFLKNCNINSNYNYYEQHYNLIIELMNNPIIKSDHIYNLFELDIIGLYYYYIKKNYELSVKYFLMAVDLDNSNAMNNLGMYYYQIDNNYELAHKYFLMTIEHDELNDSAMNNLGCYYMTVEHNYELTVKYFLMAINHNNSKAMNNLGWYYSKIKYNYELGVTYFLMAINYNNSKAMNNLASYYNHIEHNYVLATKYYLMAIEHNYIDAISNLNEMYRDDVFEFYKLLCAIPKKNEFVIKKIRDIKQQIGNQIICWDNKKRLFEKLNNYNKCPICLTDDVLNIDLDCGHEICVDCYRPNMKCYFKCIE